VQEKSRALRKEKRQTAKVKAYAKKQAGTPSSESKPPTSPGKAGKPSKVAKVKSTKKSKSDGAPEPAKKKRRVEEAKSDLPAKDRAEVVSEAKPQGKEKEQKGKKKAKAPVASEASSSTEVKKPAGPPPSIKNIARSATSRAKAALAQSRKAKTS
jgi:hypothetical protein